MPPERCPDIERATGGKVRCEDLRPDLMKMWSYLRGHEAEAEAGADSRSHPSPLAESGQGAKPGCASVDQGATAERVASVGQQQAVATKTAASERREVA